MNDIFSGMREERLRYAIKRECERQVVSIETAASDLLIERAREHIDAAFTSNEERDHAAEKAERALNPVISLLANDPKDIITYQSVKQMLEARILDCFPWVLKSR